MHIDSVEPLPDRVELLRDLAKARFDRDISVAAIKLLLEELRRDQESAPTGDFDDLDNAADNVEPIRRAG